MATSNGRHKRCNQWMIAADEGSSFWLKLSAKEERMVLQFRNAWLAVLINARYPK